MFRRTAFLLAAALLTALAGVPAYAQGWNFGTVVNVSDTMGIIGGRVCLGEASRQDIGCPAYAPSVTTGGLFTATSIATGGLTVTGATSLTTVSATIASVNSLLVNTVAGGAGLTLGGGGVSGSGGPLDRISTSGVSSGAGLAAVVADAGTVSFTLGGTAGAAYLHPTLGLVAIGVSTTGSVSASSLFVSTVGGGAGLTLGGGGGTPAGVSGSIQFNSGGAFAGRNNLVVDSAGRVGISTSTPNAALEVAGRISTTVLQLGQDSGACNVSTLNTIRIDPVTEKFQICRRL